MEEESLPQSPPKSAEPQRLSLTAALDRAQQLHTAGRLDAAEALYRSIVAQIPTQAEALHRLGLIAHQQGDHRRAAEQIGQAIAARPAYPEAHNNLGLVLQALGDLPAAVASHRRAVEITPDYAIGHYNLANALREIGDWPGAIASYRRAIAIEPGFFDAQANLGGVLAQSDRQEEALACYRQALRLKPDSVPTLVNLASLLRRQGRFQEALAIAEQAVALAPRSATAQQAKGVTLSKLGQQSAAVAALRLAVMLEPGEVQSLMDLAWALRRSGQLAEAASCYLQGIELNPDQPVGHDGLGTVRLLQGRIEEAAEAFDRAIERDPADLGSLSNRLLCRQYLPGIDRAALAEAHAEWERRHGRRLRIQARPPRNDRDPDRRLRVGLISNDLGRHPVGYFVLPLLEARNRGAFEILCYSDRAVPDDLTQRLEGLADRWQTICGISDRRLAEVIHDDGVDILIDLAGHTGRNRLGVFARKPAPLQMSWAGYVGTTGLTAIDYLIADRFHCPPEEPAPGPERVIRLPDGYVCYAPPDYAPPVSALPASSRGQVTFASFSNLAKLNAGVLATWAHILGRLPGSRLIVQTMALAEEGGRADFAARCTQAGIDPAQLDLRGPVPHEALLRAYNEVDIALDPFPYSGGLTTCEALWMGVPVVTFPGATFAGRHSTSHLNNVGLPELVARDREDYVAQVLALAQDRERLAGLRLGLRARMAASPLCDAPRYARAFEGALREAWQEWCRLPAVAPAPAAARLPVATPGEGSLRVAVVTPYFQESLEVLRQTHDSVRAQSYPATHILVADGHPRPEIQGWKAQHIVLPQAHGFGGNGPRAIGSISAVHQGFDAIAYLDADNWFEPDHIALMVALHRRNAAAVCVAMRTLHRPDGSLLCLDTVDSDGDRHVDTSCLFLARPALRLAGLWGMLPRQLWPLCDVLFWQAVKANGLPIALADRPTVAYRTTYAWHYRMQGESVPDDTKRPVIFGARHWFKSLPEAERQDLQRYLTTGAW